MDNKMVEPSYKRVLIAVLVVLIVIGIVFVVARGYIKQLPSLQILQNQLGAPDVLDAGDFTIHVPADWDYTSTTKETGQVVDVFTGPILSEYFACSGSSNTFNHFWVEVRIEPFSKNDDYASFRKYYENQSQSVRLIDELEIGGQTPLSIYALPPLEKCDLRRFTGMALTRDGKLVLVSSRGPAAEYQEDFKELFQSILLK